MKKIADKKSLQLNKQTVRALVTRDLEDIVGGRYMVSNSACDTKALCN